MQDLETGSQISQLGFDGAYAYEKPDFEMASTIEGLRSSFNEYDKRIAVGFDAQSLEIDAKKNGGGQLSERDLPLPPQSAKVITIFGGGLKDLLPGYLIQVATKTNIERINLWSFDIEEIKNLFDYLHKNPPTSFIGIQTIFNFMSPVLYPNERGKKADRRSYPLDELFNELKEWEKDRFGIPNLKVCFSDYERTGTDITKIVTNRRSLPTFMNLYVTLPQTAAKLNQIRGLEVGVLGQKKLAL